MIAFDVKAWDESSGRFVDLGEGGPRGDGTIDVEPDGTNKNPRDYPLRSSGAYATKANWGNHPILGNDFKWNAGDNNPSLARVYDTWTDAYEIDARSKSNTPANVGQLVLPYETGPSPTGVFPDTTAPINDWACPPPYGDTPLPGVQVTIRTFDPRSGHIREVKHIANLR